MLGDISFKLETKIMNFMSGFFLKKYKKGKNGKYDFAIKRTTDNILQILLQASR
jgi:hypothetical protein